MDITSRKDPLSPACFLPRGVASVVVGSACIWGVTALVLGLLATVRQGGITLTCSNWTFTLSQQGGSILWRKGLIVGSTMGVVLALLFPTRNRVHHWRVPAPWNPSQTLYTHQGQVSRIGFINGACQPLEAAEACQGQVCLTAGRQPVTLVYNATHSPLIDYIECLLGLYFYVATSPVGLLQEEWDRYFDAHPEDGTLYLQFCYSQGAIHVRNALLDYDPERRKRIVVVAIAHAAYIPPDLCHESSTHYANTGDPIRHLDWVHKHTYRATLLPGKAHDITSEMRAFIISTELTRDLERGSPV